MIQLCIGDSTGVYFFGNRSSDFSLNTTLQEDIRTCEPFDSPISLGSLQPSG